MNTDTIGKCRYPTRRLEEVSRLGYTEHHAYMEAKLRRHAKQAHCATCDRWRFRDERCGAFAESEAAEVGS